MLRVSVITVCKNAVTHIQDCLASVSRQTYQSIEHVIVDGGSTDGTLAKLGSYASNAERLVKIVSEPDTGIYDAMNKGIHLSTGGLICFLNSDDYFFDSRSVEWVINEYLRTKRDFVVCNCIVLNPDNGFGFVSRQNMVNRHFLYKRSLMHPSSFFTAKAFEINGLYDTSFRIAADYDWYLRSLFDSRLSVAFAAIPTTVFRLGGLSSSPESSRSHDDEVDRIRRKYFGRLERALYSLPYFDFFLDNELGRTLLSKCGVRMFRQE